MAYPERSASVGSFSAFCMFVSGVTRGARGACGARGVVRRVARGKEKTKQYTKEILTRDVSLLHV